MGHFALKTYENCGYTVAMTDATKTEFNATLYPNNSLTQQGFLLVVGLVVLVSSVAGIFFWHLGAWPVTGFFGLDVVALYLAFRIQFAAAQQAEQICVQGNELIVRRVKNGDTVSEARFNRNWVKLELVQDRARELIGALLIHSHGQKYEVGSFLGPDERKSFFKALQSALWHQNVHA